MAEHNHNHDHKHGESCCGHHHYTPSSEPLDVNELDAGNVALANALKVSFFLLKVIMAVFVIWYFASGFYNIDTEWQGLVLRCGKITGQAQDRVKQPGYGWRWPSPIDELVIFPVKRQQTVELDKEFWYFGDEKSRVDKKLVPDRDGYCITRNDLVSGVTGNDYNILHSKWEIKYHIGDIEQFFKNVYMQDLKKGQDFYDIKKTSVDPMIKVFASNAVVNTLVRYSIDDALTVSKQSIAEQVKKILSKNLREIESGITVDAVLPSSITWPRQVGDAFLASTKARLDSDTEQEKAHKYANEVINQAGGRNAMMIVEGLEDSSVDPKQMEIYWNNIAGQAKNMITTAQAYRTKTIESAKANAIYLEKLLPEYRQRPELVLQKLYQDAVEEVLSNVDEKIFIQPKSSDVPREIRLMVSRDASIKKKKSKD